MQNITVLQLGAALAIIIGLALAWLAFRAAQQARAIGYDQGYDDARNAQLARIELLQGELDDLSGLAADLETARRLERDELIQDADRRIAIYARRASPFGVADRLILAEVNAMLKLAANTFSGLQAYDSAVRARDLMAMVQEMDRRLVATLPAAETTEQEKAA